MTTPKFLIRIDNCIVRELHNGMISVESIQLFRRRNPNVMVEDLPYVFTGSRRTDSLLIQRILSGSDFIINQNIINPNEYIMK
jgi:hypothetical protein